LILGLEKNCLQEFFLVLQTPDEWDDGDKSRRLGGHARFVLYKRSKSVGSGDQWGLKSKDVSSFTRCDHVVCTVVTTSSEIIIRLLNYPFGLGRDSIGDLG